MIQPIDIRKMPVSTKRTTVRATIAMPKAEGFSPDVRRALLLSVPSFLPSPCTSFFVEPLAAATPVAMAVFSPASASPRRLKVRGRGASS